jgi:hypothetical protein
MEKENEILSTFISNELLIKIRPQELNESNFLQNIDFYCSSILGNFEMHDKSYDIFYKNLTEYFRKYEAGSFETKYYNILCPKHILEKKTLKDKQMLFKKFLFQVLRSCQMTSVALIPEIVKADTTAFTALFKRIKLTFKEAIKDIAEKIFYSLTNNNIEVFKNDQVMIALQKRIDDLTLENMRLREENEKLKKKEDDDE